MICTNCGHTIGEHMPDGLCEPDTGACRCREYSSHLDDEPLFDDEWSEER